MTVPDAVTAEVEAALNDLVEAAWPHVKAAIEAEARDSERQRIRDGATPLWLDRDVVRTYEVPADLLDGAS